MFEQLILHAVGDYLLQNDWMAQNKTKPGLKGRIACEIHCLLYALPFFLIGSFWAVLCINALHFAIDRHRLAVGWIKFVNWNWKSTNFGYEETKPIWMSTWLLIIVDNTWHIVCNYLALKYL